MAQEIFVIEEQEAIKILSEKQESHFLDFKSKELSGKGIQKIVTAFANADGGELYIGIKDEKERVSELIERWDGSEKIEQFNQLIQNIYEEIKPVPQLEIEFLKVKGFEIRGIVLKVTVFKSADIHYTSADKVFIRKSAQKLELKANKKS